MPAICGLCCYCPADKCPALTCAEAGGLEGFGGGFQQRRGESPARAYDPMENGGDARHHVTLSNGFLAGDASKGLQPGAALLRQLQAATVLAGGSGGQPPARMADDGAAAFGDPAIMAARITRSAAGPPPGFGGPPPGFGAAPAALRRPPPGFSHPAASPASAAQLPAQPQQPAAAQPPPVAESAREAAPLAPESPVRAVPAEARASNGAAAAAVAASPRSSRGGKKKRGGKGRPAASGDGHSLDGNAANGKGRRHNGS